MQTPRDLKLCTVLSVYNYHLNFTRSVCKLVAFDANDPVLRLDLNKCLQFLCLLEAKELVAFEDINSEPKLGAIHSFTSFPFFFFSSFWDWKSVPVAILILDIFKHFHCNFQQQLFFYV